MISSLIIINKIITGIALVIIFGLHLKKTISNSRPQKPDRSDAERQYHLLQQRIRFLKRYVNIYYCTQTKTDLLERIQVLQPRQLWNIANHARKGGKEVVADVDDMIFSAHVENVMKQSQPLRKILLEAC